MAKPSPVQSLIAEPKYLAIALGLLLFISAQAFAAALPAPGKFLDLPPVSKEAASSGCPIDPKLESAPTKTACRSVKFEQLGAVGSQQYFFGWYHRPISAELGKAQAGSAPFTEQLVLYSSEEGKSDLQPKWTDVVEIFDDKVAVTGAKLTHSPLGEFVELQYYSGGSAGAWTDYFVLRNGRLNYIQQQIDEEAAKCLPKGYGIQSKTVDLANAAVEVFAPNDDDPSCCPSGRIHLALKLNGEILRGEKCKFSKSQN